MNQKEEETKYGEENNKMRMIDVVYAVDIVNSDIGSVS